MTTSPLLFDRALHRARLDRAAPDFASADFLKARTAQDVVMRLVDGPFSNLDGSWKFQPLGDNAQRACKVTLELHYGFKSAALAALVGPVFDKIAGNLVDAFVKRAEQMYG